MNYTMQQFNDKAKELDCPIRIEGTQADPQFYYTNEKGATGSMTGNEIAHVFHAHPELLNIYMHLK